MEENPILQTNPPSTRDIMLKYGLIAGGISILITAICYVVDYKLLFGSTVYFGTAVVIISGVLAALVRKKANNGYISYGESVGTSIGTFSIAQGLATIFGMVLYLLIDPSMVDKMKNFQLQKMDEKLAAHAIQKEGYKVGVEMIEKMNSNSVIFYSIGGFIVFAVLVMIVYLITSIFIRNESPFKNNSI